MNTSTTQRVGAVVAWAALVAAAVLPAVGAAAWPADKPIRMIVPYGAGGASDTLGRIVAARLSVALKQTVVVENKPGAGSMLGSQFVARAEPDGYTLLLGSISNVLNNYFYKDPLYDLRRDLAPVSQVVSVPNYLAVNTKVPAKTVGELVKLAKDKPESLSCATSGIGSSPYLSCELFRILSGTQIVNVPFKSGAEAIQSVIGGQAQVLFANEALPFITSGQVRALGVTTPKRSSFLPDVPAIGETLPGYDVTAWYGIWAPAGTSPAVITRISEEIAGMLKTDEVRRVLTSLGAEPVGTSPTQFKQYVDAEMGRWQEIVNQAGIKPQ
ncbi:tripartite tricarboxylate transporter substrate binding protein [Schauerella aestuarii]|uniref:tripartite tricarboxylate transporter substrate binding protein n=1 Tax=Schauerella aestuarii TaxID=2511204 RepID=UPI00136B49DA|nr:tripartite tricarboxylate transporter substrate binding protein [Achromobacter aestuarii]MYZ44985.1 tripartite tricarboxylate transporter substrate binding protein [Achromobacter aestuarii]